jgi:hypothetical protein
MTGCPRTRGLYQTWIRIFQTMLNIRCPYTRCLRSGYGASPGVEMPPRSKPRRSTCATTQVRCYSCAALAAQHPQRLVQCAHTGWSMHLCPLIRSLASMSQLPAVWVAATKEPKLQAARRIVAEWSEYDAEVQRFSEKMRLAAEEHCMHSQVDGGPIKAQESTEHPHHGHDEL